MSTALKSGEVAAYAKLNLFLEVRGKRADGYHELRSIAIPLALCDRLRLRLTDGGGIRARMLCRDVPGVELLNGAENLAVRAVRCALQAHRRSNGARLAIHKRIPVGGGLGGGSADAAAALVAAHRLLGQSCDDRAWRLAAELGSDVPAILNGGAVAMRGRGEQVETLLAPGKHPPGFWLVLANPGLHVSTAEIYRCCKRLTSPPEYYKTMVCSIREGEVQKASSALFNGLQPTVFALFPVIRRLHDRLLESGALGAMVCGSGASVFGLARNRDHAEQIRSRLPADCWSTVTQTLPDGVMVAHGPLEP